MNRYKAPTEKEKKLSKKEAADASNKQKKKVVIILTLSLGLVATISSIDKSLHISGAIMVGLFTSLLAGIPLLFFYVFTKKRY